MPSTSRRHCPAEHAPHIDGYPRATIIGACALLIFTLSAPARAQQSPSAVGEGAAQQSPPAERERTEITILPLLGGNNDAGFGGGAIGSIARINPHKDPYFFRVEFVTTTLLKVNEGQLVPGYQDHYALLELPWIRHGNVKAEVRAAYTREIALQYYGIGNDSRLAPGRSLNESYYEYNRLHPTVEARAKERLGGAFWAVTGVSFTYNELGIKANTKLFEDAHSSSSVVREMITPLHAHGVLTYRIGAEFDTRDTPVSPRRGQYHTAFIDLSPGGGILADSWGRFDAALRWYLRLDSENTALAARLVTDLLFGRPPFYELAREDETGALGGPNGVRGVPGQRFHGEAKVFGNVELRRTIFHFSFLGKSNGFGMATFVDAGRLWATYSAHPELDGSGLGLKWAIGAGPRILAGQSFVLRGDVAWSPDQRHIGVYIAAGHIF